jgi:hypothetical protein
MPHTESADNLNPSPPPRVADQASAAVLSLPKQHKNLVIVRAGDSSLHEGWISGAENRNWDIVVNYFGHDPHKFRREDLVRIDSVGPKWSALHKLVQLLRSDIAHYDFVWFPDDDLASDVQTVNRIFSFCRELHLQLAQPALSLDSFVSYPATFVNASFLLRFTNFIEIMAPVFSRQFLERCADSFGENLSGYGLDSLWPTWVAEPDKIAILDACPVRHTRPVGGPNYKAVAAAGGKTPMDELEALLHKYGINQRLPLTLGGIDRAGRVLLLSAGHAPELAELVLKGYLPALANHGEVLAQILRPLLRSCAPINQTQAAAAS